MQDGAAALYPCSLQPITQILRTILQEHTQFICILCFVFVFRVPRCHHVSRCLCNRGLILLLYTDKSATEIQLFHIDTKTVKKIVTYLNHHVGRKPVPIEKPLKSTNLAELVGKWDSDFMDVSQEVMFKVLLVS